MARAPAAAMSAMFRIVAMFRAKYREDFIMGSLSGAESLMERS